MRTLLASALVISALQAYSQDLLPKCRQHVMQREFFEQNPQEQSRWELERQELERHTQEYIATRSSQDRAFIYHIPVVFHILHDEGVENISDAQVLDALRIMNRDFRKRNADTADVAPEFQGVPADIEIEFVLAHRKPDGSCFSGITRTRTSATYTGEMMDQVNAVRNMHGDFVGNKYLNIFVVQNANGAAGYTTYPNNGWTSNGMRNGIWIKHEYTGSIGTSSVFKSRALTHEAGHWFNLAHVWGSTNDPGVACGTDNVADTPQTMGWTTCTLTGSTCDSLVDNVENYMEYAYCSKMFTPGQRDRMRAAVVSTMGGRSNIWTAQNLQEVGVQDSVLFCNVDFGSDRTMVCVGEPVSFHDASYNGAHDVFWSFSGGTPSVSDTTHPVVTYDTPGRYDVSLIAFDSANSYTSTRQDYIWVVPDTGLGITYHEGFENLSTLDGTEWFVENTDQDATWQLGPYGNYGNCVWMDNHNVEGRSRRDELILATVNTDIADTSMLILTFDYAYKRKTTTDEDQLKVSVSADCGQSWTARWVKQGVNLGSETSLTPYYAQPWEYKRIVLYNITSQFFVPNMMVKFEFISNEGGNIFLDNINIFNDDVTSLSLADVDLQQVALYPNPTQGEFSLAGLPQGEKTIILRDMRGRLITQMDSQDSQVKLDLVGQPSGIYLVELFHQDQVRRFKVVKGRQ